MIYIIHNNNRNNNSTIYCYSDKSFRGINFVQPPHRVKLYIYYGVFLP